MITIDGVLKQVEEPLDVLKLRSISMRHIL